MRSRRVPQAVLAAVALAAAAGLGALAGTVYVKAGSAPMLDKPDKYKGKLVKRLHFRDKLERLEKGEKWDKVRSGDQVGYVRTRNLVAREPKSTRPGKVWGGKREGTDAGFSAGARGLGKFGKDYAKEHNFEEGVKVVEGKMDKMKRDDAKLDAFQREGRLGDYAADGGER